MALKLKRREDGRALNALVPIAERRWSGFLELRDSTRAASAPKRSDRFIDA